MHGIIKECYPPLMPISNNPILFPISDFPSPPHETTIDAHPRFAP